MGSFKKTFKLLDVAAEKEAQVFISNTFDLTTLVPAGTVIEVLEPIRSVTFNRVVIFTDKAIVQGTVTKNLIFKLADGTIFQTSVTNNFAKAVELPGLTPTVTVGRFNRVVPSTTVFNIGPNNTASSAGFDIQIYVTSLNSQEILVDTTTLDEKIVLDFILKISKFTQQDLNLPAPNQVFEFRNVIDP